MSRKELFTILGAISLDNGRKRFSASSPDHLQASLNRLAVGQEVAATFSVHKPIRSQSQLAYHYVLMDYLADYTGHSKAEMHEAVMLLKFGSKRIAIGDEIVEVRRSLSESAGMTKAEVAELIEYDLGLCARFDVRVPTKEELGYLPS